MELKKSGKSEEHHFVVRIRLLPGARSQVMSHVTQLGVKLRNAHCEQTLSRLPRKR
jgi:hypothetical protein